MIKTPNIKLLKNEQYINHIDFWHSIIKIQYISNHLKPKNFKECNFGHFWINESKSPIYSTVAWGKVKLAKFCISQIFGQCNCMAYILTTKKILVAVHKQLLPFISYLYCPWCRLQRSSLISLPFDFHDIRPFTTVQRWDWPVDTGQKI